MDSSALDEPVGAGNDPVVRSRPRVRARGDGLLTRARRLPRLSFLGACDVMGES
jgi:hypothetical protein